MVGNMVSNAVSNAVSNTNKKPGSGSSSTSRPSGSGSGSSINKPSSSGSGSSASRPSGTTGTRPGGAAGSLAGTAVGLAQGMQSALGGKYTDSNQNVRPSTNGTDYAALYQQYYDAGDYDKAQEALDSRYLKLGSSGSTDTWQRMAQQLLDGKKAEQQVVAERDNYKQMFDSYAGKESAITDGISADVERNIANLNAQRPLVQQAGAQANAAAQQGYYSAINPNGMSAEQRAALGLSDSGLTESAQIAASNAYQSAVNSNAQNVSNQLAQIDLAIENARLSGDIATAQQLQSYYDTVLQAGMQAAGQIANINQWALENKQNQFQQNVQNGFTQAGITGQYNGQLTLAGQQAVREFQSMDTQNKLNALNLAIQQAYGMKSADADYLIKMAQLQGQNLDNLYLQAQIEYARKQF